MTAAGTVAVAVVAVGVALWAEWRADKRLAAEREHSAKALREEREHSAAQLAEERRLAQEREQWAEAYAVMVLPGEVTQEQSDYTKLDPEEALKRLGILVVNRGRYTITRVEARFSPDGKNIVTAIGYERLSPFPDLPDRLKADWGAAWEPTMAGVLTPWDTGLRFVADVMHVKFLTSSYPVVRWTDHWGTRWEHRRGEVRQSRDGEWLA